MSTRRPVIKKVFVTMWCRGIRYTFLCDAVQVGKHFQVSMEAYNEMSSRVNVPRGTTITQG